MSVWAHLTDRVVHGRTGLVNDLVELQVDAGEPNLHFFAAQLPDLAGWLGFSYKERSSGAGRTRQECIGATLGEAIERYASAVSIAEAELITSSWQELKHEAVDPRLFAAYAPEQYAGSWPYAKPDIESSVRWVRGRSLTTGKDTWVPAQYVFLPYQSNPGESVFLLHTSTGLACAEDPERATLSALLEVIERDAFMIHWLARLSAPRVDWDSDPGLAQEMSRRYLRPGLSYHVFDITTDIGVPCCFAAVIEDCSQRAAMTVGAAARLDGRVAAEKAIMECVQTRAWLRQMVQTEGPRQFASYDDVHNFEDHVHLWGNPEMLKQLDFLLSNQTQVPVQYPCPSKDLSDQIQWVVSRLAQRDLEAIVVDVTPSDIRSLGLTVVRAVVPGAIPLSADHRYQALGGKRLYEVPAVLGYRAPKTLADFNPIPHPFP